MKFKDFKKLIDSYNEDGIYDDWDVELTLHEPSIGRVMTTPVSHIHPGFDWDHGVMMIQVKEPVIRITTAVQVAIHKQNKNDNDD